MWKTPGFTAAAIATLALGLGLTTAVMSLAFALFLRPPARRAMQQNPIVALGAE
jgi:hypothetical protein